MMNKIDITDSIMEFVEQRTFNIVAIKQQLAKVYHTFGTVDHEFYGTINIGGHPQQILAHTRFNEGYLLREVIKECPECKDWTLKDRMNAWVEIAERLIGIEYEDAES